MTIKLASSKPAANLSIWLVSLPWNADKQPREDHGQHHHAWLGRPAEPSVAHREQAAECRADSTKWTFDLQPDDQVIPVGQQIGLMVFSSDRDFTLSPAPGTQLTIDQDATFIELPIVGGAEAFAKAVDEELPETLRAGHQPRSDDARIVNKRRASIGNRAHKMRLRGRVRSIRGRR